MLHHTALATACLESWHHCPGLATHYTLHHADTISRGQSSYKTPHWVSWYTHCFTDLTRNHIQNSDRGFWTPIKSPEASLTDKLIYWTSALILWHTVNIWNYWHRQIRGQCGYWSYTDKIDSCKYWILNKTKCRCSAVSAGCRLYFSIVLATLRNTSIDVRWGM